MEQFFREKTGTVKVPLDMGNYSLYIYDIFHILNNLYRKDETLKTHYEMREALILKEKMMRFSYDMEKDWTEEEEKAN